MFNGFGNAFTTVTCVRSTDFRWYSSYYDDGRSPFLVSETHLTRGQVALTLLQSCPQLRQLEGWNGVVCVEGGDVVCDVRAYDSVYNVSLFSLLGSESSDDDSGSENPSVAKGLPLAGLVMASTVPDNRGNRPKARRRKVDRAAKNNRGQSTGNQVVGDWLQPDLKEPPKPKYACPQETGIVYKLASCDDKNQEKVVYYGESSNGFETNKEEGTGANLPTRHANLEATLKNKSYHNTTFQQSVDLHGADRVTLEIEANPAYARRPLRMAREHGRIMWGIERGQARVANVKHNTRAGHNRSIQGLEAVVNDPRSAPPTHDEKFLNRHYGERAMEGSALQIEGTTYANGYGEMHRRGYGWPRAASMADSPKVAWVGDEMVPGSKEHFAAVYQTPVEVRGVKYASVQEFHASNCPTSAPCDVVHGILCGGRGFGTAALQNINPDALKPVHLVSYQYAKTIKDGEISPVIGNLPVPKHGRYVLKGTTDDGDGPAIFTPSSSESTFAPFNQLAPVNSCSPTGTGHSKRSTSLLACDVTSHAIEELSFRCTQSTRLLSTRLSPRG